MSVSGREFPLQQALNRQSLANSGGALALLCATALIFLPKGFAAFGALLAMTTLLVPERLAYAWSNTGRALRATALLAVLTVGLAIVSMQFAGQQWRVIDNYARFLLIPWCGMLAFAIGPSRYWLWIGSMLGVGIACALALAQIVSGVDRAGAGSNPIVFANAVLALLVLAVCCRPPDRQPWILWAVALTLLSGAVAIVLSGSRGVLPGLGLLMLVAACAGGGGKARGRLVLTLGMAAALIVALCSVPWLSLHLRLEKIPLDLQKYTQGQVDSAIGARLEFLSLAWGAFLDNPWTGVGIDRFDTLVAQLPECRTRALQVCKLGHAHNDLAQWAATMGLPGLAMVLALYLLPFFQFLRIIRRQRPRAPVAAAWAGLILVVVYFISGMTQSMFAHAMTTTIYAVFVGLLLGLSLRESSLAEQVRP